MTKLCPRGKAAAKRKFKVYPSAYANAYASKICAGKIKDPSGVKRKDFKKLREGKRMQAKDGLTGDTKLNKKLKNLSNSLMKVDRRGKPEDFMKKQKSDRSRKIGINTYRRKP